MADLLQEVSCKIFLKELQTSVLLSKHPVLRVTYFLIQHKYSILPDLHLSVNEN